MYITFLELLLVLRPPISYKSVCCVIGCLHDPANVQLHYNIWQQTFSITFAGSLLDRVNTPL